MAKSAPLSRASSNGKKVVVIDPGHDSVHAGAARDELREETLNFKIAMAAYNELRTYHNVEVYLTRSSASCPVNGGSMSSCLLSRAQLARDKNADLFVSFHNNATGATTQTSSSGAFVYISNYSKYDKSSRLLTDYILSEFKTRIGLPVHGAWLNADDGNNGYYDDGRMQDDLSVIRNSVLYGVEPILIEHAYMNNPTDKAILRNDAKLTQMGIGDARGIAKYLGLSKVSWDIASLNASVSGSKVTLTPSITGTTSGLQYKYVYNQYNPISGKYDWQHWGVIGGGDGFSSSPSKSWNVPNAGQYEITLDVKDGSGNIKHYTTTVNIPPSIGFNGVSVPANANLGDTITIKPNVSSNVSGLKYKFVWSYNNWSSWGTLKNFSTSNSASMKLNKLGTYEFYVDIVTPEGGLISKSAKTTVSLGWNPSNISFSPSSATKNTPVNITGSVSGGSNLQYKFVYSYNNWSKWGVIRDFTSSNKVSFTPQFAGKYDIYMDVKDAYGNVRSINRPFNASNGPDIKFNSISVPANASVGNTVTITPNVGNPIAGLKYKFVYSYNDWSGWGVISELSSSNKTATMQLTHPGKYEFFVDIETPSGDVFTKTAVTNVELNWNPSNISFSSSNVKKGTPVNITGAVSGGSNLQYKFVYSYNNWSKWGVIRDFASSNKVSFTPQFAGKYDIYMDVMDSYGNVKSITRSFNVN